VCGEPVPSDRFPTHEATAGPTIAASTPTDLKARKSRTLRAVLAVMCGMAVMALIFALLTRNIRRERDPRPKPEIAEEMAQKPADLLALGYLPPGVNVVVGLQVAALSKDPGGQDVLREPRPAFLDKLLDVLEVAGLSLADVDHVVAGTELKSLKFDITTVVVTRRPVDQTLLDEAVGRHKFSSGAFRNGTLYRFADIPKAKLWSVEPRVLIYTTLPTEDLARIPAPTKEPAVPLTPAARTALVERLHRQSRLWAVGDLEPAKDLIDTLQLLPVGFKDQLRLLTLVRSFAVGMATSEPGSATLSGEFYTGTAASTAEVRKYLEALQVPGAKPPKVAAPQPDIDAAEAQWVSWQVRADTSALRAALEQVPRLPRREVGPVK
jgi:hypothetical protein